VGAVDCDDQTNRGLAAKYAIQGFPTLKVFTADGKVVDFQGQRTAAAMSSFLLSFVSNHVVKVSQDSVVQWLAEREEVPKLMLFTDKKETTTLAKSLSTRFKDRIVFGQVHADSNPDLVEQYGIKLYPSLLIIKQAGAEPILYQGDKSPTKIKDWIEQYALPSKTKKNSPKDSKKSSAPAKDFSVALTSSNFEDLVVNSKAIWMVEFFAPWCGHCKALPPKWTKAANSLKGIVKFGTVDCTVETALAQKYGIQGYPTIKVFVDKNAPYDYPGGRDVQSLSSFAVNLLPNNVRSLNQASLGPWIDEEKPKTKFLLMTEKNSVPPMWKSVAHILGNDYAFGAALASTKELAQAVLGQSSLPLPLILRLDRNDDNQARAETYAGPIEFESILKWVSGNSSPTPAESKSSEEDSPLVVELTSDEDFQKECVDKLGLCVLAFPNGDWEGEDFAKDAFWKAAEEESKASSPLRFAWVNRRKNAAFAEPLRLPEDGSVSLIAIQARKKRYALFVGAFNEESVREFLSNVLRGRISTTLLDQVPRFDSGGSETQ